MEFEQRDLFIVMVGLPARGKSFLANKIASFLRWRGVPAQAVNVGAHRRHAVTAPQNAEFFSADNPAGKAERERVAMEVLHQALEWLTAGAEARVVCYDATNTTRQRRVHLQQEIDTFCAARGTVLPYVLFLECICNDEATLLSNMLQKVTNSPDYRSMPVEEALADLRKRIAAYELVYEPLADEEDALGPLGPISYVKTYDLQSKLVCRRVFGTLAFFVVSFLMAQHIVARPIYLVRAGQCTDDDVRARIKRNVEQSRWLPPGPVAGPVAGAAACAGAASSDASAAIGACATACGAAPASAGFSRGGGGGGVARGACAPQPGVRTASDPPPASGHAQSAPGPGAGTGQVPAPAPHMYESLSKMSAKITTSALSAGLTLNLNGRTFAAQLTSFLLRRTAAGRLRPSVGRGAGHAAAGEAGEGVAAGGGGAGVAADAPSGASSPATRVGGSVRGSVVYRHPTSPQAQGATPITEWGGASGTTAAIRASGGAGGISSAMSRAHTMPHALDSMVGPAALPGGSPGADGQTADSRSSSPPLRRIVSEATLVAEEPPRPLRVALRESSLEGSTALLPPPSSGSRRSSPEAGFGRPPGAADGGHLLLRGRSTSAPAAPAPDSDEQDGIVASAPLLAQNDHYKRSATSAPDAAAGAGAGASGDDAGEGSQDAPPQPLAIYEAEPAIYTSTLPRTIDMVGALPFPSQQLSALNPMDTGICLGIPMQYMSASFPDEFRMWMEAPDRARYRIPGGESLMDVVERLTPFVIEIERQKRPVVVVSHLSTLQVLLAYFKGVPLQECIDLECPMNTVVRRPGNAERGGCCRLLVSATHMRPRHAARNVT